jgi:hypothetical protein
VTPYDGFTAAEHDVELTAKIENLCDPRTADRLSKLFVANTANIHNIFT